MFPSLAVVSPGGCNPTTYGIKALLDKRGKGNAQLMCRPFRGQLGVPGNTSGHGNMAILDWEGWAHKMLDIGLVGVHEEDSLHKCYMSGQWAMHSWYYYTGSPVPKLPKQGVITTTMAFYLCSHSGFLFGNPKAGIFLLVVPHSFAQPRQVPMCN